MKKILIYDLDGTLISSDHRYRNLESGSIDLPYWIRNATPANIAKDTLLPLAAHYKAAILNPLAYVIVATARLMSDADYAFLHSKLGKPDHIISRRGATDNRPDPVLKVAGLRKLLNLKQFKGKPATFFEDNPLNIEAVAKLGITCIKC